MAHTLDTLTEALSYATTGFQRKAVPDLAHTHLRSDPQVLRMLTAEKYVAARARPRNLREGLRMPSSSARCRRRRTHQSHRHASESVGTQHAFNPPPT